MTWWWRRKRHLRYASIEAWIEGENIALPVAAIADAGERDRRITEYGELRQHLFAKHLKTLSSDEQHQLTEGTHPSQSHRFADRAQPVAAELKNHFASMGFVAEIDVGFYHGDRIVLDASLATDPGSRRSELPWLYRGFEVKYSWPQGRS